MKADYSQTEFTILFLGVTAILSYPLPLPNYQLPIVAISLQLSVLKSGFECE
jgi:hypothetical protein